jgi:hypothetical protein
MPALNPTDYYCDIVWLGRVADPDQGIQSAPMQTLVLTFDGPDGEAHGGATRPSCSRVLSQHPRGTEIRNVRQLSVVSQEELDIIADKIGLDAIDPAWLGATVVVRGIPDFSHVPPSSRLQSDDGTTLAIDMQNRPCHLPAKVISAVSETAAKAFKTAAMGRRGVTAWVERPGALAIGNRMRLHIPDQRAWSENNVGLEALRF